MEDCFNCFQLFSSKLRVLTFLGVASLSSSLFLCRNVLLKQELKRRAQRRAKRESALKIQRLFKWVRFTGSRSHLPFELPFLFRAFLFRKEMERRTQTRRKKKAATKIQKIYRCDISFLSRFFTLPLQVCVPPFYLHVCGTPHVPFCGAHLLLQTLFLGSLFEVDRVWNQQLQRKTNKTGEAPEREAREC